MNTKPYTVVLPEFAGPLDLLLHLVRKAEIDLKDIFVSEITEQYLEYVQAMGDEDMERASDFLRTASLLLYIKSRALLPLEKDEEGEEPEEEDPQAAFIESLRLYEMYQKAASELREKEGEGENFFAKPPEEMFAEEDAPPPEFHGDAALLQRALVHLLEKRQMQSARRTAQVEVKRETWSISAQKKRLLAHMQKVGRTEFVDLFAEGASTEEIVTTFAAMLELWSAGALRVSQDDAFAPIELVYVGDLDGEERAS